MAGENCQERASKTKDGRYWCSNAIEVASSSLCILLFELTMAETHPCDIFLIQRKTLFSFKGNFTWQRHSCWKPTIEALLPLKTHTQTQICSPCVHRAYKLKHELLCITVEFCTYLQILTYLLAYGKFSVFKRNRCTQRSKGQA